MLKLLAALCALLVAAPALAQETGPLERQAAALATFLGGEPAPADLFAPAFLAAVPESQMRAIAGQLTSQLGAVTGVEAVEPSSATAGTIRIGFARGVATMTMSLESAPPHRIAGLLVTDAAARDDSLDAILAELRSLPGTVGLAIARLDGSPDRVAALDPDRPFAVGSAFKLIILAELDRQVAEGSLRWDAVVPLAQQSLPSGFLGTWPKDSPLTLYSLAALMISQSDNSATDTLLHLAGRENVEAMQARLGIADSSRNQPFLDTREAFAIKAGDTALQAAWTNGDTAARRALLAGAVASISPDAIDPARFTGAPALIESVEWFASPADLVRVMDWFRRSASAEARAILAINSGLGAPTRDAFAYVGYKGGSESGVLNLTWLVTTRAGAHFAVTGSWNDPAAALDNARFAGLMMRAVQILR